MSESNKNEMKFTPSNLSWDEMDDFEEEVENVEQTKEEAKEQQKGKIEETSESLDITELLNKLSISGTDLKKNNYKLILIENCPKETKIKEFANKLVSEGPNINAKINIKSDDIAVVNFKPEFKKKDDKPNKPHQFTQRSNKVNKSEPKAASNTKNEEVKSKTKDEHEYEEEKKDLGYINGSDIRRSKPKIDMNPTRRLIHHALGVRMTPPSSPRRE